MATHYDVIILGGGNAAGYAARAFVQQGYKGSVAILGSEKYAPYERPALSKGFLTAGARLPGFYCCVGSGGERQLPEWYEAHNITLLLGREVVKADLASKTLESKDGSTYTYGKLIISTGSSAVRLNSPGSDLRGIYYLREYDESMPLAEALQQSRGGQAVIVGGGYIGLEAAAALAVNGLSVTVVVSGDRVLQRLFTPEIAKHYEQFFNTKGVNFIKGDVCESFSGESGHVTAVNLKSGRSIPAGLVVVGVGARPNVSLFADQLTLQLGGILVNERMEASVPDVYAMGDVATFPQQRYGRLSRVEHVTSARKTATSAVASIVGTLPASGHEYVPFFYSRIFNLSWKFYGDNAGDCICVGNLEAPKLAAFWVHDDVIQGVMLESGSDEENALILRLAEAPIEQRKVSMDVLRSAETPEAALQLAAVNLAKQ